MQQSPGQIATRFTTTRRPPHTGRTPTLWLRERLSKAARSGDPTAREQIYEHLLEVATKWEVVVIGKDRDGELLKVASGRDSVEAAKLLFGYDMGKPAEGLSPLQLAEHLRQVEKDRIAAVISVLGAKLRTMSPSELAEFFRECANDPAKFLNQAGEVMAAQSEGLAERDFGPGASGITNSDHASPKGCDMASHAPGIPDASANPCDDEIEGEGEDKP